MRRHHKTYLEAIKQTLVDAWGEAIGYGALGPTAQHIERRHNGRSWFYDIVGKINDLKVLLESNKQRHLE